ncbi:hypothetical protein TELCIR_12688, partial [Teladorsagia circumcincta]
PADIIQVTVSLIAFRYPVAGWTFVLDKSYIAKIGFVLTNFACNIELFTQLMLSINRLTAICYPMKHNYWWTLRRTVICFACAATVSMVTPTIRLLQDAGYVDVSGKIVPYLIEEKDQKTFDQQFAMARRLQLNLLVYSSAFTLAIISMTVFQTLLASDVFPLRTDAHALVIIMLTISADCFALANPWLLLALSTTFRSKFVKVTFFCCTNEIWRRYEEQIE